MNKKTILSSILSVALLTLAACSNDENKENNEKVDVTKAVEFKVDFADYNDKGEADITRAGSKAEEPVKLEQKMVDLGNGVLAECTLQRDTTKHPKPAATRAIPNDTYTMLAYDAATHTLKGEITGTVTSGVFTSTSANKDIILEAGKTYDFVLFNSKVARSGNNLTVTRTDADAALIGRKTETIAATPKRQQISFTLKHVGAKVKIKLTGYMNFSGVTATLASVNATDIPSSSTYDASTGTWSVGTGAAVSENLTYGANPQAPYTSETYTSISNKETMFMPTTDISKLKLTFDTGNIYNISMANAGLTFNPSTLLQLEQNGSYVLNVKLMYAFLYLMSDGSIGTVKETIYGGKPAATAKTPIAVVLSRSKHMAIALKDAVDWTTWGNVWIRENTYMVTNLSDALLGSATSGKEETWNASYSINGIVKGNNMGYHAFYDAGHYDPGVTYTGTPALQWYLPSYSDWTWAFSALGLGNRTSVTIADYYKNYYWYGGLAKVAFTQVGGKALEVNSTSLAYWSSTETPMFSYYCAGLITPELGVMRFSSGAKDGYRGVRSFVAY